MSVTYEPGQTLEILWRGKWYRGHILRVVGEEQWEIHYDAFDSLYDEVVGPDRLRTIGSGGLATSDEMPAPRVVWAYALFVVAGVLFVVMLLQPKGSPFAPGLLVGSLAVLVIGIALRPRRREAADPGAASPPWDEHAELEQRRKEEREFSTPENRVRAKIVSAYQSGQLNLMPAICFSLRIEHPDGPYDVIVTKAIEPTELHHFSEGRTIEVYVNPKNRKHVVLRGA